MFILAISAKTLENALPQWRRFSTPLGENPSVIKGDTKRTKI